jgi:hypothetical protein
MIERALHLPHRRRPPDRLPLAGLLTRVTATFTKLAGLPHELTTLIGKYRELTPLAAQPHDDLSECLWHLAHFPQKTEEAVIVHCVFTRTVMALCTAFRLWQAQAPPEEAPSDVPAHHGRGQTATAPLEFTLLGGEGTQRWRRRLHAENRDKVIVFVGEHYGIFHVAEFAVLAGLRIKSIGILPELGSRTDILARYGLNT